MKKLIAILILCALPCLVFAPPVGQTSEWGIVISPCAWCGKTNVPIQVHHIIPQAECKRIGRPELIRDTNNMVCLCRTDGKGCHFYIGHHGISWRFVFTNVMEVIKLNSEVKK
jgi:hypothetical protein